MFGSNSQNTEQLLSTHVEVFIMLKLFDVILLLFQAQPASESRYSQSPFPFSLSSVCPDGKSGNRYFSGMFIIWFMRPLEGFLHRLISGDVSAHQYCRNLRYLAITTSGGELHQLLQIIGSVTQIVSLDQIRYVYSNSNDCLTGR